LVPELTGNGGELSKPGHTKLHPHRRKGGDEHDDRQRRGGA
jgi:hypothetical protein